MKKHLLLPAALLLASCSSTVTFKEDKALSRNYSAFLQMANPDAAETDPYPYKLVALPVGECRGQVPDTYTFRGGERVAKQRVYLQYRDHEVTQPVTYLEFYPHRTQTVIISDKGIKAEEKR